MSEDCRSSERPGQVSAAGASDVGAARAAAGEADGSTLDPWKACQCATADARLVQMHSATQPLWQRGTAAAQRRRCPKAPLCLPRWPDPLLIAFRGSPRLLSWPLQAPWRHPAAPSPPNPPACSTCPPRSWRTSRGGCQQGQVRSARVTLRRTTAASTPPPPVPPPLASPPLLPGRLQGALRGHLPRAAGGLHAALVPQQVLLPGPS